MKNHKKVIHFLIVVFLLIILFNSSNINSQTIFKVPANPYETCVVDYDQDGDNDIVVGCNGPNQDPDSLIIFFNDGWGNFEFEKFQASNQIELKCIDLTGDNYPDIITQTIDNIIFYENDKNEGIANDYIIMNIDCSPKIGGIADINNDNTNDLVYYCRFIPYGWGVQFNNGDYTFTDSAFVASNDHWLRPNTGDLNNDDRTDILVTTVDQSETVHILYNNYPNFEKVDIATPDWNRSYILNLNNDSLNDIILFRLSYFGSFPLVNMINEGNSFQNCDTLMFVNGSNIVSTGDYDLDGYDDLTMTVYQANNQPIEDSIYIYFNDQHCGFKHVQSVYMGDYGWLPTVNHGDLNGDGYPELVIQGYHFPRNHIRILWNDGTGNFIDTNSVYVNQPEIESFSNIIIYPNPSSGMVSINSSLKKIKTVTFLDLNGRTLFEEKYTTERSTIELNLNNLLKRPGIFLFALQLENEVIVFKKIVFVKP